jgi:adhesin transport system outer membrane protein
LTTHVYRERRDGWLSGKVAARVLGLAFAGVAVPLCGNAKSLNEAVAAALSSHPQVLAAEAAARAARLDVDQARGGYFPSLDVNLGGGRETTESPQLKALGTGSATLSRREAGVTLTQKLFDGFATRSEVERQNARVSFSEARVADARETVALRVVEVYLEILKNQQLVKLARDNIASHLQTLQKVQQRVKGGVSQRVDLQQIEARVALARSTLTAREGRLREAEVNYQRAVGEAPRDLRDLKLQPGSLVKDGAIDSEKLAQTVKAATETALARNPNIAAADAEVSAAEAAKKGANAALMPRLNLELGANRNRNISGIEGDFNNETAMVVMRWNLFRGGADQAQEKASAERYMGARDTATDARRQVEERVGVALHAKATSEERLAFLEQHVKSSTEALQSYQAQLDLGRRSLLDVLNAESELFTARSNLVAGTYEDILNQYAVEAAKGLLVLSL